MHWIYEDGIGEERAALVDGGTIIQARIERRGGGIRPGAVVMARLVRKIGSGRRAIARLATGEDAIVSGFAKILTEGQDLRVRITRAAIKETGPEHTRHKYALGKETDSDTPLAPSPDLKTQIAADDLAIITGGAHANDALADAGWGEVMQEASSGVIAFPGGSLVITSTPAMTVIDVDGEAAPRPLSLAAAQAVAAAIHRLDIGGSVGIDFPVLPDKTDRTDVASAFDSAMYGAFERTAVNGFGFMQVVRKYERPSLVQITQHALGLAALLTLLRHAERERATGSMMLHVTSAMRDLLSAHPEWLEMLGKRTGRPVVIAPGEACSNEAATLS